MQAEEGVIDAANLNDEHIITYFETDC